MNNCLLITLVLVASSVAAEAQSVCINSDSPGSGVPTRVVRNLPNSPPNGRLVVGKGLVNTWADEPVLNLRAGDQVSFCDEPTVSARVEMTHAAVKLNTQSCTTGESDATLFDQVVLTWSGGSGRNRSVRRNGRDRQVHGAMADRLFLLSAETQPLSWREQAGLHALGEQVRGLDGVVAWGLSHAGDQTLLRVLFYGNFEPRPELNSFFGYEVLWTQVPDRAFASSDCEPAH